MRDPRKRFCSFLVVLAGVAWFAPASAQESRIMASGAADLAPWAGRLQQMADAGLVRLAQSHDDPLVAGRRHQRFAQLHNGVPVWGGELVVQTASQGLVSVFGTFYQGIDLDTHAAVSPQDVDRVARGQGGVPFGREGRPELVVLPVAGGRYALAYKVRVRRPASNCDCCSSTRRPAPSSRIGTISRPSRRSEREPACWAIGRR